MTGPSRMAAPLAAAQEVLAGEEAWIVGGALRDRLLGRPTDDLDIALDDDPRRAARALAARTGAAAFCLSGAFGAWRVVGPERAWSIDLVPLHGDGIAADLAARDFTINAMAEPLDGHGTLLDPHGGREDLGARRLRTVAPDALERDPLRALRAVRLAVELGLGLEPATAERVRAAAPGLEQVASERTWAELKRIVGAPAPGDALLLLETSGLTEVVLPELLALRGVGQSAYHHLDVHDHTLAVLDAVVVLERDPAAGGLARHADAIRTALAEPFADELTRGGALRWAAVLHDAAKPQTREERGEGKVSFVGHDRQGAELARGVLGRLKASQHLRDLVAAVTREHLRLGFLVHERPLTRRAIWRYLAATAPYELEVTVFTVADRLATRGRKAAPAIEAHLAVAEELLGHVLARRARDRTAPLVRGHDLVRELGVPPGPALGRLLAQLEEDRFAGEVSTPEEAITRARALLSSPE